MFKRTDAFEKFNHKYPNAQSTVTDHPNGNRSDVRVGMTRELVDCVFVGVYRGDGTSKTERIINERSMRDLIGASELTPEQAMQIGINEAELWPSS